MLKRVASGCGMLGALALMIAAANLLMSAIEQPSRRTALLSPPPATTAPRGPKKLPLTSADALGAFTAEAATGALGLPSAAPAAEATRALLYVDAEARGEVLIDGRSVGYSPYVGDVACTAGEVLQIEWLPSSGEAPREFRRPCAREVRVNPERDRVFVEQAPR